MVCCLYGRYGCCYPGAKRAVIHGAAKLPSQNLKESSNSNSNSESGAPSSRKRALKKNVYAMFEIPTWTTEMPNYGMTLGTYP
jgi:hypothetical protein